MLRDCVLLLSKNKTLKIPGCSIESCKNWNNNVNTAEIKFFRFPRDPEMKNKWIKACDLSVKFSNLKDRNVES